MHFIRLESGRFTTRFARDTEAPRIPCRRDPPPPRLRRTRNVAGIPVAGVPFDKLRAGPATIIPATPLGVIQRERGATMRLLPLNVFLQETVAFILATVFPWAK
jgi:hypothetical protein